MRFDLAPGLGSELAHQRMQGGEHVEKVARLRGLVEHGLDERLATVLDRRHGVGDDENAERRSGDDAEFERLKQHLEMPAKRRVAAADAAAGDHEATGEIQDSLRCEDTQGLRLETYAKLSAVESATDKPAERSFPRKAGVALGPAER